MSQMQQASSAEATRDRIARAALALFNERGYASTTVREIVEAAGVTKPVLYYHFESKEGLYTHLMAAAFRDFEAALDEGLARPGSATDRLRELLLDGYGLFVRHSAEARLMHSIYYGPPQGAPPFDFDTIHLKFEQAVRQLLTEGMDAGEFRRRDVYEMSWAVIGLLNVSMELHLCHPERAIGPDGLARAFAMVLEGLAEPGAASRKESR